MCSVTNSHQLAQFDFVIFKYFTMLSFRNVQITSIKLLSLLLQITREASPPYTDILLSMNIVWPILERIGVSFRGIIFNLLMYLGRWEFNFSDYYWGDEFNTRWKEGTNFKKLP